MFFAGKTMQCLASLYDDDHGGGENWKFFAQQSEVSQSKHVELKSKKKKKKKSEPPSRRTSF